MKRNGNGRAARLRGRVGRLVAGLLCCAGTVVAASPRLTYVGESNGVWTASGAWRNEAGETVDWSDGAFAVIDGTPVQVPEAGVTVDGLSCAPVEKKGEWMKLYVRGDGKLTVGAAGITLANKVGAEVNLQPKGGLHLTANQDWTATDAGGMLCLDGDVPLTAETGVQIHVEKSIQLRVNVKGRLGPTETVVIEAPSSLSPAQTAAGRGLGMPKLILSGEGNRAVFGSQWEAKEFATNYASHLVLRDGADIGMSVYNGRTNGFGVPRVTVDGTATVDGSRVRGGGVLALTQSETVFDVAAEQRMTFEPGVVDAPGGAAGVVKRGAGTLVFSGAGTAFSGGVSVEEGTVAFTADATLAGAVSGTVSVAEGKTVRFGSVAGPFTKTGAGTAVLGWGDADAEIHVAEGAVEVGEVSAPPPRGLSAWLDATAAASLTTNEAGVVSNWADRRGGTFAAVQHPGHQLPVWTTNALNGLPVLDFGRMAESNVEGDDRMMAFSPERTEIRTVFWVIGSKNGGGFLLGDSHALDGSKRHFHRGGDFGLKNAKAPLWGGTGQDKGVVCAGETWVNGVAVDGTTTGLSGAYDLVGWRISETDDADGKSAGATWLASCYAAGAGENYRLNGGQELGELLIYTNRLTDAERDAATAYLARKWFPQTAAAQTVLAFGTVMLEGAGAAFRATAPTHLKKLVVQSGCTFTDLGNLTVDELVFEAGATLRVVYGEDGKVAAPFTGAARIVFPKTMTLDVAVPEGVTPVGTSVLAVASDAVTGVPVWTPAPGVSAVYRVVVDAASRKVSLAVRSGTFFILR